jgi:lipopolysaccharide transport system permease protein
MAGMGLGLGIIISSLTTKYRDFTVLIGFAVQLMMYATPVAYPLSFLENKSFAPFIEWNPLSAVVEGFRYCIFQSGAFTISYLIYPTVFCCVSIFAGALIFTKVERTFMDTV